MKKFILLFLLIFTVTSYSYGQPIGGGMIGGPPTASESTAGVAKLATNTDATTGTNNTKIMSPADVTAAIGAISGIGANETYGSGWNSDTGVPEKDDVYDYLHQFDVDDDGDIDTIDSTYWATKLNASEKAAASGVASLDGSSLVVQNPANATATPTASKIPIADGSGDLDAGWVPDTISHNLAIGSTTAGKNLTVNATLGSELVTWTDAGWNEDGATWTFAASVLTHVTGNATTVTAAGITCVAGTTYKVTITGTGGGGTATYTLGGVTGTTIAASGAIAITDYITVSTTASLIITPASGCTVAISNISVKALTDATGDLTVDGNIKIKSPIQTIDNVNVIRFDNPTLNTFLGYQTGTNTTAGYNNTFVGWQSGLATTSGNNNTGIGIHTLLSNTSGSTNTAVGGHANPYGTYGYSNTSIGYHSLYSLAGDSNNNVALGYEAGALQANGSTVLAAASNSVYIGSGAMGYNDSDSNSIVIGYEAVGAGANTVVVGNDSITDTYLKGIVHTSSIPTNITSHSATEDVTAATMYGNVHKITGAYTVTLPAAVVGMSAIFRASTAAAFSVDTNAADHFEMFDGTVLDGGDKITSSGTKNEFVTIYCESANTWIVIGQNGAFTDGGA
jgi:hypothetical protein